MAIYQPGCPGCGPLGQKYAGHPAQQTQKYEGGAGKEEKYGSLTSQEDLNKVQQYADHMADDITKRRRDNPSHIPQLPPHRLDGIIVVTPAPPQCGVFAVQKLV